MSRLWIAAAERAIDGTDTVLTRETAMAIRIGLRAAAIEVEFLMEGVAGERGVERSRAIATLVQRFGDDAVDVDHVGATAIAEAVAAACNDSGLEVAAGRRLADECRATVLSAGASLDAVFPPPES